MTNVLEIYDEVTVPSPLVDDLWLHSFKGYVKNINENDLTAIIEDADGNCFEVELNRLEEI